MRAKERFQELHQKKIKFSLNMRLTVVVGAVVLVSLLIAFGMTSFIVWIFPVLENFPALLFVPLFSLAVAMIATRFLSRLFFDHIKQLRGGMRRVAEGDFSVRLESRSSSIEIQEMLAGFNMMAQELGSTEILQTDFVSNVSHEFKTPINAIEGYTTLLQGCDELLPEQRDYVEKILFNTQRLSALVSNILLLSKVENQSIQTNQTFFDLDEQIRETVLAMAPAWEKKEIELDVDLEFTRFYGNEGLLYHVWSNLISNAIKFSPVGGKITLRLRGEGDKVCFAVEDQGPGFSEEEKKHLFDQFYQGDSSHKEEGNGLGLALVKKILALVEGEILAENLPTGGCRFAVTLPVKRKEV